MASPLSFGQTFRGPSTHNANVGTLVNMEGNRIDPVALRGAVKRLKWRQEIVAGYCRQLVEKIEALGIPEPVLRNGREVKAEGSAAQNNVPRGTSATSGS